MRQPDTQDQLLLETAGAHLTKMGFSYDGAYLAMLHQDLPLPALGFEGTLGDLDVGAIAARVGRLSPEKQARALDLYTGWVGNVLEAERGTNHKTKRIEIYWRQNETWTVRRLSTVFAPVGMGYYGVPFGGIALGFHVAEIVYYLSRAVEGVEMRLSDASCVAEVNGELVGVVDDQVLMPGGGTIQSAYRFESHKFFGEFRHTGNASAPRPPLWAAISAFLHYRKDADPALIQALAHCRHYYAARADWDGGRVGFTLGRPKLLKAGETKPRDWRNQRAVSAIERLTIVDNAIELSNNLFTPHHVFKDMLVPAVLSTHEFRARFGGANSPTQGKRLSLKRVERLQVELVQLRQELAQEVRNGDENDR